MLRDALVPRRRVAGWKTTLEQAKKPRKGERVMKLRTVCAILALSTLVGCGHSEDQWQAQLGKYQALEATSRAREADLQKQLADARQRVADLEAQLKDAGVDLKQLQTEKSQMASTLAERERALADYRARAQTLEAIRARYELLRKKLDELTRFGLGVTIRHNRMVISLPGDVLFDTGKDTLRKDGEEILKKVAAVIRADRSLADRDYQVAGHTDAQPLQGGPFHDNWGLSLARSRSVLLYLIGKNGNLPRQHWSAAGFADTDPVASNATKDGQQKNRRCELIVVPDVDEMIDLKQIAK
jgi:chemotaxis protein MotB